MTARALAIVLACLLASATLHAQLPKSARIGFLASVPLVAR